MLGGIPNMLLEIIALTSAIASPFATYIVGKALLKNTQKNIINDVIEFLDSEECDNVIEGLISSEKVQKALYTAGGFIGSGAAQGLGLQKGSGKMKLQDVIIGLATGFMQRQGLFSQQQAPTQTLNERRRTLNIE